MAERSAATLSKGSRFQVSKGLLTVLISTAVLFALSAALAAYASAPLASQATANPTNSD